MHKKSNLPTKLCATCGRTFVWRKKWESVWDEVKYCSDRCRSERSSPSAASRSAPDARAQARVQEPERVERRRKRR